MSNTQQIFILGNSRSGTTMMGRLLSKNQDIHTLNELHFFGVLCSSEECGEVLDMTSSIKLLDRLFYIEEHGIFKRGRSKDSKLAASLLVSQDEYTPLQIFHIFLNYIANNKNTGIVCEQTPNNILYIQEILEFFPGARIINMIRDPRDIMLSQKNKWRRRYLGSSSIPFRESLRSYFNYHPIVISKIWNTSIVNASKFRHHPRFKTIYFEEVLFRPEETISDICKFLNIEFSDKMLDISNIGSSTSIDSDNSVGLDKNKVGKWKKRGLSNSEIYICQKICMKNMRRHNYILRQFKFIPFPIIISFFTLPLKILISLFFNMHRIRNIKEVLFKRILN